MRLVHLADLHLGAENYGRLDPQTGLNSRLFDFLRCLDAAVECALGHGADAVLFAGDAYRSREPSPTHQREFAQRIHRLAAAGVPTLLVAGNHDLPALPAKASALDLFSALEVPGVRVVRKPEVVDVATSSGAIRCACFPAMTRAGLLEDGDRRLDADALRRALSRRMAARLAALADAAKASPPGAAGRSAATPPAPVILVAHVGVEGAMLGSEVNLVSAMEPTVPLAAVADRRYAYVALGHVHRFQEMNARPPVVYAGSLERVDFGEEGQQKGFVVVDLAPAPDAPSGWQASYQFMPTPARRFVTVDVDLGAAAAGDETADATERIERVVAAANVADAVARVRIEMPEQQPLDDERLRRSLREAFVALPLHKRVHAAMTIRGPGVAERMTDPLAALAEYLKLREVSQERARALRAKAESLLAALTAGDA
jgi:exonuclease SbcD